MAEKKVLATAIDGGSSNDEMDYGVGDAEPISQHQGELRRAFKARHIQMITLGTFTPTLRCFARRDKLVFMELSK